MLKWVAGVIATPRVIPFKLFRRRADARLDIATEAQVFLTSPPISMSLVQAPQASNDDAMESVFEEVEQALKWAGLIAA
ncbi:hypothetical protein [Methylobacterium longum]|uniref:Uncharacterized protein n=1 Tax=Methylobacterium longum TaxID=767694 RepID=A0ABT8AYK2_9HYPH|nr:hypothetical protein [Methylobacterium longum]MDN3575078.1 hypothetical protein [Methylobacterium longum]GJE14777.1 hypothetical protein FOHLNKBM_5852 [Methylobacterium longum]